LATNEDLVLFSSRWYVYPSFNQYNILLSHTVSDLCSVSEWHTVCCLL